MEDPKNPGALAWSICKIRLPDGTFAWSVLRICSPDGAPGGVQRLQSRVERPQNPFNGQGSRVKHPIVRGTLLPRGESVGRGFTCDFSRVHV